MYPIEVMEKSSSDPSSRLLSRADSFAQQEPMKAVVSAFGVGFLLNLLPIGAIVAMLVAMAFSLVRPVLLFMGLMKALELFRSRNNKPE